MSKWLKYFLRELWHFISDVRFALVLISLSIILVTLGTFYEGQTQSHNEALSLYRHPLFMLLLGGYFLNILTSALRRWPFQKHHIGFLITHLGLLMILLGQIIKVEKGVQGHLLIQEGTEKNTYIDSENILIEIFKESPQTKPVHQWVVTPKWGRLGKSQHFAPIDSLPFHLTISSNDFAQRELYSFWLSSHSLSLEKELSSPLLTSLTQYVFYGSPEQERLSALFKEKLVLQSCGKTLLLDSAPIQTPHGALSAVLKKDDTDFLPYAIEFTIQKPSPIDPLEVWLYLLDDTQAHPWICKSHPLKVSPDIEITCSPFLALYQTQSKEKNSSGGIEALIYCNENGRWQRLFYSAEATTNLLILKKGYGALAEFFEKRPTLDWRKKLAPYQEGARLTHQELNDLYVFWSKQNAVAIIDEKSPSFSSLGLDWNTLTSEEQTSIWLLHHLTQNVDWSNADGLWLHLKERFWPLADELKEVYPQENYLHPNIYRFSQLLFQIKSLAPLVQAQVMPMLVQEASYFQSHPLYTQTLWLTLEGLHPSHLLLEKETPRKTLPLISKVERSYIPSTAQEPDKELSTLQVRVTLNQSSESLEIPLEKLDRGLPWPLFDGQFWIKASHPTYPLGYTLRLYQTFAKFYPGSLTAQNYYAQLSWQKDQEAPIYVNVSMNNVLELPSGYRFYLSSITPLQPTGARTALFAVSYDPYKNILTYPGAILVSLGSLILLIRKRAYVQQLFR